jgi:hypothetical protein
MKLQLFKNGKGLIYGTDNKRISCDYAGTLSIGTAQICIDLDKEAFVPVLFNGVTGEYNATFTSALGNVYELERVSLRGGRIVPPSQLSIELMELRCRVDALETECEALREQYRELANIFDTNSLNFLIK